jgi:hypothetical protein
LVKTIVDENGEPIFTEDDISTLMGKSRTAIDRLVGAAVRVNRMGGEGWFRDAEKS